MQLPDPAARQKFCASGTPVKCESSPHTPTTIPELPPMADTQQAEQTPQQSGASRTDMANAIRALTMDAVQAANSGHPGAPMGMADMAVALWGNHLQHNPTNPLWANRDRFVLSNGHGSMLLYALDRKSTRLNSSHANISYDV